MNDYIRREDAIKAVLAMDNLDCSMDVYLVRDMLKSVPAADVRPAVEWVSVKDRLPEIGKPVLGAVYTRDRVFCERGETLSQAIERTLKESIEHPYVIVCFYEEDGWTDATGFPQICTPTFWAELPDPPKVKDWRDL